MLIAKGVSHAFGQTVALVEASATVMSGESVALVGPSGSGKTTLLYCMSGLIKPTSGDVSFEGRSLTELSDSELSQLRLRSFGFVFQFAELVPELTLRENISLPLDLVRFPRKERARRVDELLDRLGLTEHADRRPAQVSGGQAQRAAVARAVVHRPSVVFADEPTGALDSENSKVVVDLLFELSREQETAVVLVTHDNQVASQADRRVEICDGKVITAGAYQC